MNLEHSFLFLMHFYTGVTFQLVGENETKDSDKWVSKINSLIHASEKELDIKPKEILENFLGPKGEDPSDDFLDEVESYMKSHHQHMATDDPIKEEGGEVNDFRLDHNQTLALQNLIQYIEQAFESGHECVSIENRLVKKILTILQQKPESGDEEFFHQVASASPGLRGAQQGQFCQIAAGRGSDALRQHQAAQQVSLGLIRSFVIDKLIEIRRCVSCNIYCPSVLIEQNNSELLINTYSRLKKGSDCYLFAKIVSVMKNDESYLTALWTNYRKLSEGELLKKIKSEGLDFQARLALKNMHDCIADTRLEKKIDVQNIDQVQNISDESGDSFLEPMHMAIKSEIKRQHMIRMDFAAFMTTLGNYLRFYINHKIREFMREVNKELQKSTRMINGQKERFLYERILYNCKLGFSNWKDVTLFDKENKFVKMLRQSIYGNGVSQLIFQDLTKNEKSFMSSKFLVVGKPLQELLKVDRFQASV
jgi:hypothetical protein